MSQPEPGIETDRLATPIAAGPRVESAADDVEPLLCPACSSRMPSSFRFCGQCGTDLENACPGCGAGLPPRLRFCGFCGLSLAAEPSAVAAIVAEVAALPFPDLAALPDAPNIEPAATGRAPLPDEELRRVAILFADLAGSTAIADRLEPEHAYRLVSECIAGLGQVVADCGGYVVKTLGDGLMALFGAPTAHGDDPERAARAALRMQEWLREHNTRLQGQFDVAIRVRVGINFGSVVAAPLSAGGRPEYDVLGDAVNVAQRIESAAEPGAICVSESFYRITRGEFEYRSRGVAHVKGKSEPLTLYQLVRARASEASTARSFPLVGREKVVATLSRAARELPEGRGAYLVLTGSSGMGKTRLLEELAAELAALGIRVLRGNGSDAAKLGPLALWRGWLADLLPIHPEMAHADAAGRIRAALRNPEDETWAEWLAALVVEPQRLMSLEPDGRDRTVQGALRVFLQHWQEGGPAALLVDEADALDTFSAGMIAALQGEGGGPLLVALSGRVSPAALPTGAQVVGLRPLSALAARKLISLALPEASLEGETLRRLVDRGGGSPLFLTLMLQAARETGNPGELLAAVPDSLYGLIQAQIDRLTREERRVAQSAAVLGRAFSERWLELLTADEQPQAGAWQALEQRGILEEHRPEPHREIAFRHGALQEVLYEGLLKAQRRELHARAAAILSTEAGSRADLAARAAWHWRCAERWDEALQWTLKAADHAAALYAGEEAQTTYRQCVALAEKLKRPGAAARGEAGLAELAEHQGEFAAAIRHFHQSEAHLDAVASTSGFDPQLRALRGRVQLGHARVLGRTGALTAAQPLIDSALSLLKDAEDLEGRRCYVRSLTEHAHLHRDLGQLEEAERSARRALKLADDEGWRQEAAAAASALGRIYPLLGNWPAAEGVLRRAAQLAEAGGNWREAAGCWINLGSGLQSAGRLAEAAAALDHALEQARRIGDVEKTAIIRMNLGTVHLNRGDWPEAERSYRAALEQFQAMEHSLGVAYSLYNLTETLRWAGNTGEARELVQAAAASAERTEAAQLRPHVMLAEAELMLAPGAGETAVVRAQEALQACDALSYESGAHQARLTLGRALAATHRLAEAETHLEAAVEGFEHMNEPLEEARARGELAAVYGARGWPSRAREMRQSAVDIIERLEAHPWLAHLPPLPESSPAVPVSD